MFIWESEIPPMSPGIPDAKNILSVYLNIVQGVRYERSMD